jgi:molecular chaperone GrpE
MSSKKKPSKDETADEKTPLTDSPEAAETPSTEEPDTAKLRDMMERFAKEAERLALELADEKERSLRIMAEYDNFRKRSQKERENIYSDVRGDTLLKFLPVFDNLERAIRQETGDEAYKKGVELIMTQFREIMASLGVSEIEAGPGQIFDPSFHNAVMHVEDESLGEGVIAEELQKGFRLGDKVLRFSVVKSAN